MFGFNNAKYDLNLIKPYLMPILVTERDIEPIFIKKVNRFISFKFGNIQLLDKMNSLGGATSLDSFLKAYKTSETKGFFTFERFDHPDKMQNTELPHTAPFTVNFVAVTLLKLNTRTMLIYWKVDWPQNKPSSK